MASYAVSKRVVRTKALNDQRVKGNNLTDPDFIFLVIVSIITVMAIVLFYVWSRLEIVNLGYNISKENSRKVELLKENKALRLELVNLKSPERIERIAREKSGLFYPLERQIVVIR
ncbi:MAG: cell division protein FtsL [Thermodesulfobacteriota bacterium]